MIDKLNWYLIFYLGKCDVILLCINVGRFWCDFRFVIVKNWMFLIVLDYILGLIFVFI